MKEQTSASIKEINLGISASAASVAAFWLWKTEAIPGIVAGDFHGWMRFAAPVAGLAAAAALFALSAMFIRDRRIAYGAGIIGVAAPYLFSDATRAALILLGVCAVGAAFAVRKIRREFSLSIGFSVSKIARAGLSLYFTVACVIISFFYAGALDSKNALAAILPKPAFDLTLHYFLNSSFARSVTGLPVMRRGVTADELLDMLAREQLKKQGISPTSIPAADMARLRRAEHDDIARQYGISFQGNEKVQDIFYAAVAQHADELMGPYRAYLPAISALAFFFALKALTLPLYLLALVLAFVLIKGLLSATVLKRATEQIEVERITF